MHQLILASQSPRRRDLLVAAGFKFRTHPVEVSEILEKNLNPVEAVRGLALKKSEAAGAELKHLKSQGFIVITADTIVAIDGRILGKPASRAEATEFLDLLSGQKHQVITALSLLDLDQNRRALDHQITEVRFRRLTPEEVSEYVDSGDAMDKAGGYGIQGEAGKFVENLVGPLDNVIGLPVELLKRLLVENGWRIG